MDLVSSTDPNSADPRERSVINNYNQYLITLKSIVENLEETLNIGERSLAMNSELSKKLTTILDEIELQPTSQQRFDRFSTFGAKKSMKSSPSSLGGFEKGEKPQSEFSFKKSDSDSRSKKLHDSSSQKSSKASQRRHEPKEESKYENYEDEDEEEVIDTESKKNEFNEDRRGNNRKTTNPALNKMGLFNPPKLF